MRARTGAARSPMPPEKTSVSSPPSVAASAPIAFLRLVAEERRPRRRRAGRWPRARADRACRRSTRRRRAGPSARLQQIVERVDASCPRCAAGRASTPGSRSPERVPIGMPEVGVKPMVVSTQRPLAHRREARAGAEVREHDPPARRLGAGDPRELLDQERVREAVEAVAPHAAPPRSGAGWRAAARRAAWSRWNAVSKQATCGSAGAARAHRLDDGDLGGQVVRVERARAAGARRGPRA